MHLAFNLYWGKYLKPEEYALVLPCQRLNHFPGSLEIGHKGRLYANLNKMRRQHGAAEFSFVPDSFMLPRDYPSLERAFHAAAGADAVPSGCSVSVCLAVLFCSVLFCSLLFRLSLSICLSV